MSKMVVEKLKWSRVALLLAGVCVARGQQYSITTVAGGQPPATPVAATKPSLGPAGRVTLDSAGNVYFSAGNCVYRVDGTGTLTLIAGNSRAGFSGDGGPAVSAQLNGPQGLAVDSSGNIFIADSLNNRIRVVSSGGTIATFAGNGLLGSPGFLGDNGPALQANLHFPSGIALDSSGNLYIADTGNNSIRRVTPLGARITTIAGDGYPSFTGNTGPANVAELAQPEDVTLDSSGNIYIADTGNAMIRKVTTDGNINCLVGPCVTDQVSIGYSGDGGPADNCGLIEPFGIALDATGNIFIAERADGRIREVRNANINTIVGNGSLGTGGDGGPALLGQLNLPAEVVVDSSGNLYIADTANYRIRKVSSGMLSTLAGDGMLGYSGDGGPATSAQFNAPGAVAADASGNIYIADTDNNVVRKVSGGTVNAFAGNGLPGAGGDGLPATQAQMFAPQGLALDSHGDVYIADTQGARVRIVTPNGQMGTAAGDQKPGYSGDGGPALSAQLNTPIGLAVDGAGNLYIADELNCAIRKVNPSGTITTVAGNGTQGYTGDGGPATQATLHYPQAVAVDSAGNIYIGDTGNNVVRMVSAATGVITTIAGTGVAGDTGDGGQAVDAEITGPLGLTADVAGNLYITDSAFHIRKVYPNGLIITIAGSGQSGYSGDGGLAINASLNSPSGLAVDPAGNVYIADTGNNAVRELQYAASGSSIAAVTNGASNLTGAVSPGELVVLYGSELGPGQLAVNAPGADGLYGTTLAGVTVYFNGTAAPIVYASATQVAAAVPYAIAGSSAQVYVAYNGQTSPPVTVPVAAVSPAIFTLDGSGEGQAAAINQDLSINGSAHPADAGTVVALYVTGLGQTNPLGVDGLPGAPNVGQPEGTVLAAIGGQQATVKYAAGAPGIIAGVFQVNLQVPAGLAAGNASVEVQISGQASQGGVTIAVSGQ